MHKYCKHIAFLILICISVFTLISALSRPIWFDEAWSIMVYATLPYSDIYTNYNAPNNHILFNMFLRLWLNTLGGLLPVSEIPFRLITVFISLLAICLMFQFWRKRLGLYATFLIILCFSISTPFIIYGTAVRGYMLSFIFIVCGLEAGLKFIETQKSRFAIVYFLSALCAIAVIPSNLFAFAMITIIPSKTINELRCINRKNNMTSTLIELIKERWLIATLPLVAFFIFYGPIWKNLYYSLKSNNGWLDSFAACIHLYSALLLNFLPILILSIIGAWLFISRKKKKNIIVFICYILICLMPGVVIMSLKPAPFPRVFLQMWPIWLFMIGIGVKHLFAVFRLRNSSSQSICNKESLRKQRGMNRKQIVETQCEYQKIEKASLLAIKPTCGIRCALLAIMIIAWGGVLHSINPLLSTFLTKRFSHDDFYQPAYMRKDFNPLKIVDKLLELTGKKRQLVFLSQNADFPSLIFYGKLKGVSQDFWISDYQGKKELNGVKGAPKYFLVVRNEADLSLIKKRFNLSNVKAFDSSGFQKIYEVNNIK